LPANLDFWFEKKPSGNPAHDARASVVRLGSQQGCQIIVGIIHQNVKNIPYNYKNTERP
jgi:hypothetical protein